MARIGMFTLPFQSHLNSFLAVAAELRTRRHDPIFFGLSAIASRIQDQGFEFQQLELDGAPSGVFESVVEDIRRLDHGAALKSLSHFESMRYGSILKKGPSMVKQARLEAMVIDQAEVCSGSVAEAAGLPWISVCNGLALNSEPGVPPYFTSWGFNTTWPAKFRNSLTYAGFNLLSCPTSRLINRYRKLHGLTPNRSLAQMVSPFAQISQQIREFDFPREKLPATFHYVGPLRGRLARNIPFPWSSLDGRPLVYAALGTVVNQKQHVYRAIIDACSEMNLQLVLSLGGNGDPRIYRDLSKNAVIVDFAPQQELLKRADASITHAGLNSTLESLSEGVPLVAIPLAFDQPGVAARIRWTGVGEWISSADLTASRLRALLQEILEQPRYRVAAQQMRRALANSGGVQQAAQIIEEVIYKTPFDANSYNRQ